MTAFSMGFAQAEAVLAETNFIASAKRTAFQARLKNFQRLGLFEDVSAGRGKAGRYEAHHLLLFGLAVELAQLGLPPETIVAIIRRDTPRVAAAIRTIPKAKEGDPAWSPQIIYFDPANMAPLMDEETVDLSRTSLAFQSLDQFTNELRDVLAKGYSRIALVNITGLVVQLADALDRVSELKALRPSRFYAQALYDWAEAMLPSRGAKLPDKRIARRWIKERP